MIYRFSIARIGCRRTHICQCCGLLYAFSNARIRMHTYSMTLLSMYSSTFIFSKKQFDDEFHSLDKTIAEIARNIDGYLGEEAWENPVTGLVSNVYYWASLQALEKLIHDPVHRQAKANQAKWLNGYKVVIAQVKDIYGDERLGIISG